MKKYRIKKKTKNIIVYILSFALLFVIFMGLLAMFKEKSTTADISPSFYSVGALDNSGHYKESKGSIYTKSPIECMGLVVEPNFDSTVKYQLYFYDKNDTFIESSSLNQTEKYAGSPVLAKYCRVVITPLNDEDIKFWEIRNYAQQVNISVDSVQNFKYENNLFAEDLTKADKDFDGSLTTFEDKTDFSCSKIIDVKYYSTIYVLVPNLTASQNTYVYFADKDDLLVQSLTKTITPITNSGKYVEFEIQVPSSAVACGICYSSNAELQVYGA